MVDTSNGEFRIEMVGLELVVADMDIQSRAAMVPEHEADIFEGVLAGNVPPPVVVFHDGRTNWLADGFHRFRAYMKLAAVDPSAYGRIRAEVRPGTREDAMVYSAGANQFASWPRTMECKKKAVRMLLDIPEWRSKSTAVLAKHVGLGMTSVGRWRNEYFGDRGIAAPEMVHGQDGGIYKSRYAGREKREKSFRIKDKGKGAYYCVRIGDKEVYLCAMSMGREVAEARYREKFGEAGSRELDLSDRAPVGVWLNSRMVITRPFYPAGELTRYPGLIARYGNGFVVTWTDFARPRSAMVAIGRAVTAKQMYLAREADPDAPCRMIVICRPWDGPAALLEVGRDMGVEFLTPDEAMESLSLAEAHA